MTMRPPLLEIRGLRQYTLAGLDLTVQRGEILGLLGKSGSGKTTLVRCISGVQQPEAGSITLAGRALTAPGVDVPPEKRGVGLVFQQFALFPHLTAAQNIAFGLRSGKRQERAKIVAEQLALFRLADLGGRFPHQLSGGQQQRVALARALAPKPEVLLLDEPFSNLDEAVREELRHELRDLFRARDVTAVIISHAKNDAMATADRIAFLNQGVIEQVTDPNDAYLRPQTPFVATYLGPANLLEVEAVEEGLRTAFGVLSLPHSFSPGTRGTLLLRPEWIRLTQKADGISGLVQRVEALGASRMASIEVAPGHSLQVEVPAAESLCGDTRIQVQLAPPSLHLIDPSEVGRNGQAPQIPEQG